MAQARSAKQDRFAVAVLDLDGMKQINDTLGHLAGDKALKVAAEVIAVAKVCTGVEDEQVVGLARREGRVTRLYGDRLAWSFLAVSPVGFGSAGCRPNLPEFPLVLLPVKCGGELDAFRFRFCGGAFQRWVAD